MGRLARQAGVGMAAAAMLMLAHCSNAPQPAPEAPAPVTEPEPIPEPMPEPEPAPVVAEPIAPPPAPATPAPPEPAQPEAPKSYFLEKGMSYEEVSRMYGSPGQVITGTDPKEGVVRWVLEGENRVQVRFRGGVVERFALASTDNATPADAPTNLITRSQYDQVNPGMTLYEVTEFLDNEAKLMANGEAGEKIYRWTDEGGGGFSARFEGDKLVKKTAFSEAKQQPVEEEPEGEETLTAEVEPPVEEEGEWVEGEGYFEAEEGEYVDDRASQPTSRTVYTSRKPEAEADPANPGARVHRAEGRVRVSGKPRSEARVGEEQQTEETYRERRQRARLPEYKHSLRRGVYEVKVVNESGSSASIGLRQGKDGRDLKVGAGGSASFQVDRGSYDLFYVLSDDPYALGTGGGVTIDGQVQADLVVRLGADGYTIMQLEVPIYN